MRGHILPLNEAVGNDSNCLDEYPTVVVQRLVSLPQDVIGEIIHYVGVSDFRAIIRLSHINRDWRCAANCSQLWNTLDLSYRITYFAIPSWRNDARYVGGLYRSAIDQTQAPEIIRDAFIEEWIRMHKKWRAEEVYYEKFVRISGVMGAVANYIVVLEDTIVTALFLVAAFAFLKANDASNTSAWNFRLGFSCILGALLLHIIWLIAGGIHDIINAIATSKSLWVPRIHDTTYVSKYVTYLGGFVAMCAAAMWKLSYSPESYDSLTSWSTMSIPTWCLFAVGNVLFAISKYNENRPTQFHLWIYSRDCQVALRAIVASFAISTTFTLICYRQDTYNRTSSYPFSLGLALIPMFPHFLGLVLLALFRIRKFFRLLLAAMSYCNNHNKIFYFLTHFIVAMSASLLLVSLALMVTLGFTELPLITGWLAAGSAQSAMAMLGCLIVGILQAMCALLTIASQLKYWR